MQPSTQKHLGSVVTRSFVPADANILEPSPLASCSQLRLAIYLMIKPYCSPREVLSDRKQKLAAGHTCTLATVGTVFLIASSAMTRDHIIRQPTILYVNSLEAYTPYTIFVALALSSFAVADDSIPLSDSILNDYSRCRRLGLFGRPCLTASSQHFLQFGDRVFDRLRNGRTRR